MVIIFLNVRPFFAEYIFCGAYFIQYILYWELVLYLIGCMMYPKVFYLKTKGCLKYSSLG